MSAMSDKVQALVVELKGNTSLISSLVTYAKSVPELIQHAKEDALALGADPGTLASLDDLIASSKASHAELIAAIPANTPTGTDPVVIGEVAAVTDPAAPVAEVPEAEKPADPAV